MAPNLAEGSQRGSASDFLRGFKHQRCLPVAGYIGWQGIKGVLMLCKCGGAISECFGKLANQVANRF